MPAANRQPVVLIDWDRLGFKLQLSREAIGLSQKELAAKSGVGEKTISAVERGDRTSSIKLAQFLAIVEACGRTAGDVLVWDIDKELPAKRFPAKPDDYYPTLQMHGHRGAV